MADYDCGGPSCRPPVHHEEVNVPHYAYTMHKQTNMDNWLTHQLRYDRVPVTQEVKYVEHPATSRCLRHPPPPLRCAARAVCNPPVHTEMVRVPHHIYTQHSQPSTRRWMTREVGCTRHPVTQESHTQAHPLLDSCPGGF
jgi:hypothetical protein